MTAARPADRQRRSRSAAPDPHRRMRSRFVDELPIDEVLPDVEAGLARHPNLVIAAPPGAGKTTRVPLALLAQDWLASRKIILLEPRRLAARGAAKRMAATLGESVGDTVGLRMRLESKVSAKTRIEVVTEGVFARMILDDPSLESVGAVLFDEFHERSLDADVGLALALDAQSGLREDLRIVVMSATLDIGRVAALMGGASVVESAGRAFPVETRYLGRAPHERIEAQTTRAILRALAEESGSILAFLPGQAEIARVASQLAEMRLPTNALVAPLHGALDFRAQEEAVAPARPGQRKIVLATSIAETSLTIEGVRIVVDSGLSRIPVFEPDLGLTRLETVRAPRASADQRRGRAGRTEPGVCYRLWDEAETGSLPAFSQPEMLSADLSGLALDLAHWGVSDPVSLAWLNPPPIPAWREATALAQEIGALDGQGRLIERGEALRELPLPPRLASMVLEASRQGDAERGARLALLLSERGLGGADVDLSHRLDRLTQDATQRARDGRRLAQNWARAASRGAAPGSFATLSDGALTAFAYPDRIAKRRGEADYLMANGRAASLSLDSPLRTAEFLAVAEIAGRAAKAHIVSAAALTLSEIEDLCASRIENRDETVFDAATSRLRRRRFRRLGAIRLGERNEPPERSLANAQTLAAGAETLGLDRLPWSRAQSQMRDRVGFLRRSGDQTWPDLSTQALAGKSREWLAPFIIGRMSLEEITSEDLDNALSVLLPYELARRLDVEAPAYFETPAGARHALDYEAENGPLLCVRVQELFGLSTHPCVARGRIPLTLELLSPAHRPLQTTRDLPAFWAGSWHDVKKEMRGRYPRHPWPDDPARAAPTTRAAPRR